MICPYCGKNDDKVIDSRASDGAKTIRRRRECLKCKKRFTTYERVEQTSRLMVIKRDGSRQPFDRSKVLSGIAAACGKRPISEKTKEHIADQVEEELHHEYDREVPSRVIGERVARALRDEDEVAYIRFASEHDEYRTVADLKQAIDALSSRPKDVKDQQKLFEAPSAPKSGEGSDAGAIRGDDARLNSRMSAASSSPTGMGDGKAPGSEDGSPGRGGPRPVVVAGAKAPVKKPVARSSRDEA